MFYNINGADKLIVVLYVDDGLVVSTKKDNIDGFLRILKLEFEIKTGPVGCFPNVHIRRCNDGSIFITQKKYVENILKKFNMEDANPVTTPIEKIVLEEEEASNELSGVPYRETVGCLLYLAVATRPDIAFAVSYVSQFLEKPKQKHWMMKRILKYIKGTSTLGIQYKVAEKAGKLIAYSDADYTSDVRSRRSVSGVVCMYSGGAITWCSRRQHSVSLSTTEAEYVAVCEAAKKIMWLVRLYGEIGLLDFVPVLLIDNASAIKVAKNPQFHRRTKHIDVQFHYVRERVQRGELMIEHVRSKDQTADILTKPIPNVQFRRLRQLLGIFNT